MFVESAEEKKIVLDYLKTLYDSESWNNGIEYDVDMIRKIRVTSLEDILQFGDIDISMVKIENLPFSVINTMPTISVSTSRREFVAEKLNQAVAIANEAMERFREENPALANQNFDWDAPTYAPRR